jgi:hypothetical protein
MSTKEYRALCKEIMARDFQKCRVCKARNNLAVHHIQFRSQGGAHEQTNLLTVCATCHQKIHGTHGVIRIFILAKSGNPDDIPNADEGIKVVTLNGYNGCKRKSKLETIVLPVSAIEVIKGDTR